MTARPSPTCDVCGHPWPCLEPTRILGARYYLCHECRDVRETCQPCREAAAREADRADYDDQGNPR